MRVDRIYENQQLTFNLLAIRTVLELNKIRENVAVQSVKSL